VNLLFVNENCNSASVTQHAMYTSETSRVGLSQLELSQLELSQLELSRRELSERLLSASREATSVPRGLKGPSVARKKAAAGHENDGGRKFSEQNSTQFCPFSTG
jgi:hypothetical protein